MANPKYELIVDGNSFFFLDEVEVNGYKFSIEKLSYDKGIYHPAEMMVTINVEGEKVGSQQLVDTFYMKSVSLKVNDFEVAKNYFVFKAKPYFRTVSTESSVKLELTIYSQDKLMTLDKYSKAWTGKKLGQDIFKKEMEGFKFENKAIEVSNDLQIIDYGSGEFIQPYLVQYNESFYSFLRRTANRCGEFLYHENGELHLGLIKSNEKDDTDYAEKAIERYYEDILQEGVETKDYGYNYLKGHTAPGSDDKPYSDPLTYDDYLDDVPSDYTDLPTEMGTLDKNIVNIICMALEGTSLSIIFSNLAQVYSFKIVSVPTAIANLNTLYEKVNTLPWITKTEQITGSGLTRQFGTAMDQSWDVSSDRINLNAKFYSQVRKAEKVVNQNAVYLNFGEDTQNLLIGDQIVVDGTNYLVIGVNGGCNLVKKENLHAKGAIYEERQQVIAVKLYGDSELAIPPLLPDTTIRESQAQLAFVTQTMDPEKIGRVRIRFAWQPDNGDDSPWIRVSLPFATNGAGMKFMPNINDEVMVNFEEGNIERPYVSGFLLSPHNNDQWAALPNRTITSNNGHSITFNDGINGGSFFWGLNPGLQTIRSFIPNATFPGVFDDVAGCMALTGGMTLSDRYGLYKIDLSSDSRCVTIQSAMGDVKLSAFTGITISAPNGDIDIKGKNVNIQASNTVNIESGKAIKDRFLTDPDKYKEQGFLFQNTLGRNMLDIGVLGVKGAMQRTVDKIIDMRLLRTVMDIVARPIDGTLKIKSYTFVRVEAGKGSAEVPLDARNDKDSKVIPNIITAVGSVASTIGSRVIDIQTAYDQVRRATRAFKELDVDNGPNKNEAAISFDDIKSSAWKSSKSDLNFKWKDAHLDIRTNEEIDNDRDKKLNGMGEEPADPIARDLWRAQRDAVIKQARDEKDEQPIRFGKQVKITTAATTLQDAINQLYKTTNESFKSADNIQATAYDKYVKDAVKKMEFKAVQQSDLTKDIAEINEAQWNNTFKHYKRLAVKKLLADTDIRNEVKNLNMDFGKVSDADELNVSNNWQKIVSDLVSSTAGSSSGIFKKWWDDTYRDPMLDGTVNSKRWKVGVEGKILLSDDPSKTISFNKNGDAGAEWNVMGTDKTADILMNMLLGI